MPKCDVCTQNVSRGNDSIICSSSHCAKTFHAKCVNITEDMLTELKTSGDIKKWSCIACSDEHNLTSSRREGASVFIQEQASNISDKVDDLSIEDIVATKVKFAINLITEEIINAMKNELCKLQGTTHTLSHEIGTLKDVVINLRAEIDNLKEENSKLKSHLQPNASIDGASRSEILPKVSGIEALEQKGVDRKNISNEKTIRKPTDVKKTKTVNKLNENTKPISKKTYANAIGSSSDYTLIVPSTIVPDEANHMISLQDKGTDDFQIVKNKKKYSNKRNITVGAGTNSKLKAVVKYMYLYISKLDKDTTVNDVEKYLKYMNFNDFKCDKMESKRPDVYSSFRIGVPSHLLEKIKNPDLWPVGCYINRFFWKIAPPAKPS